jgi:uncharacterized phage-associated protein
MSGSHAKLAELILYISDRHEMDETFGSVRLAKTLFYADFLYYLKAGRPITGERYIRMQNGPVPDSFMRTRDRLQLAGDLVVKTRLVMGGFTQKRPIAIREPDLSAFTADEIAMVDYVLSQLQGRSATDVSNLTHRFEAWQLAQDGEEIPYETALLSDQEPTTEDYAHARELAASLV